MGSCSGGKSNGLSAMRAMAAPAKASGCGCSGGQSTSATAMGMSEPMPYANGMSPPTAYANGHGSSRALDFSRQMQGSRHVTLAEDRSLAGAGRGMARITTLPEHVRVSTNGRRMG